MCGPKSFGVTWWWSFQRLHSVACVSLVLAVLVVTSAQRVQAEPIESDKLPAGGATEVDRAALETRLAEKLSGATLVGHFTDDARSTDAGENLTPEKYSLGEVRKLSNGFWQFQARIQYGDNDVTLPLALPVEWAGDTPVIVVDKLGFPGLGTYSARVLIYGDRYAGFWQGDHHGGHLFGRVERPEKDSNR